jgi:hypothetical protein
VKKMTMVQVYTAFFPRKGTRRLPRVKGAEQAEATTNREVVEPVTDWILKAAGTGRAS